VKLDVDDYIQARNGLIDKTLIAFDGRQFQLLALPKIPPRQRFFQGYLFDPCAVI
jgi:hypothetical protein